MDTENNGKINKIQFDDNFRDRNPNRMTRSEFAMKFSSVYRWLLSNNPKLIDKLLPQGTDKADDAIIDLPVDDNNQYAHFTAKSADVHNLNQMVKSVNEKYFNNFWSNEKLPRISWWWRGAKNDAKSSIGGLAFVDYNEILINVRFKSSKCPSEVVELLVYHEMLHIYLRRLGRPCGHTNEFHILESKFENFKVVSDQLETFFRTNVTAVPLTKTRFKEPKRLFSAKRFKKKT